MEIGQACGCDDVVNQLYACGSTTGWTETETELSYDTECNRVVEQPVESAEAELS